MPGIANNNLPSTQADFSESERASATFSQGYLEAVAERPHKRLRLSRRKPQPSPSFPEPFSSHRWRPARRCRLHAPLTSVRSHRWRARHCRPHGPLASAKRRSLCELRP